MSEEAREKGIRQGTLCSPLLVVTPRLITKEPRAGAREEQALAGGSGDSARGKGCLAKRRGSLPSVPVGILWTEKENAEHGSM